MGPIICSAFIFTVISYVYVKALKGSLFFTYCWSPLFIPLALTFYWDFFYLIKSFIFPNFYLFSLIIKSSNQFIGQFSFFKVYLRVLK